MAQTINGKFTGASTSDIFPYLYVTWSQNINNNTSSVTAALHFRRVNSNWWSNNQFTDSRGHSSSLNIGGTAYSGTKPFNMAWREPPNEVIIWSETVIVNHNNSGNATITVSANGDTKVGLGTYNFSGSVTLPQIARRTEITSVGMRNNLAPSTANTLDITLDRKSSSYTHRFDILHNNESIYNSTGGLVTTRSINGTAVNKMIDVMPTTTSRTFTFRVTTLSGSTTIGTAEKTFTVTLDKDTTSPTLSGISLTVSGSGRDSTIGKYVRTVSKVRVQFNASYGRGSSYSGMSLSVGGSTVNGTRNSSGVFTGTSSTLNRAGTITVTMTATNRRGQSTSVNRTITVHDYSNPAITRFNVVRTGTAGTSISVSRTYTRTSLDGDNHGGTVRIRSKPSNSSTWTIIDTSNLLTRTFTDSGYNASLSYTFDMLVTDRFGRQVTSVFNLSTAAVLMEKYKDEGVSIGKRYEPGGSNLQVGINGISSDGHLRVANTLFVDDHYITKSSSGAFNLVGSGSDSYLRAVNNRVYLVGNDVRFWHGTSNHTNWSITGYLEEMKNSPVISADLLNGYSHNAAGTYEGFGYYKIGNIVHFYGLLGALNATNNHICTLDQGYRPKYRKRFNVQRSDGLETARLDILKDGRILYYGSKAGHLTLAGVSFGVDG